MGSAAIFIHGVVNPLVMRVYPKNLSLNAIGLDYNDRLN